MSLISDVGQDVVNEFLWSANQHKTFTFSQLHLFNPCLLCLCVCGELDPATLYITLHTQN